MVEVVGLRELRRRSGELGMGLVTGNIAVVAGYTYISELSLLPFVNGRPWRFSSSWSSSLMRRASIEPFEKVLEDALYGILCDASPGAFWLYTTVRCIISSSEKVVGTST
jgi:hypothetical protein